MYSHLKRRLAIGAVALGLGAAILGGVTPQLGHNAAGAAEGSCSTAAATGDGWDRWYYRYTYARDNGDGTRTRMIVSAHYDYFGGRYLHDDFTPCGAA